MLLIRFLNPVWVIFFSLFFFIFLRCLQQTTVLFNVSQTNELRYECSERRKKQQYYGRGNGEKLFWVDWDFRKLSSVDESFDFILSSDWSVVAWDLLNFPFRRHWLKWFFPIRVKTVFEREFFTCNWEPLESSPFDSISLCNQMNQHVPNMSIKNLKFFDQQQLRKFHENFIL